MARTPTQTERDRNRDMMLDPTRWPRWPWLPVKKGSSFPYVLGVIYAGDTVEGQPVTVCASHPTLSSVDGPKTYTDVDAVLDDGWVVD